MSGSHESRGAVARNAMYLVVGQVVTTVLAIVLSAVLGRALGPTEFGVYFLVGSMSAFAYVLVEWGQMLFVVREVARNPARSGELLGTALALRAAAAVLVAVPVGLLAWALGYDARTCWLAVFFVLASLPFVLAQGYGMVFRARDMMGRDATVSVANKVLVLALTLPALALGGGVAGVVAAQGVAGLVAIAVASRLHRGLGAPELRPSPPVVRELLVGGAPIVAMTAVAALQPYLDVVILSKFAPAPVVGWYGAAKNVMGTLVAPATILAAAVYPRLSRAAGDPAELRREARAALRPLLWTGALGAVGTYLFAADVIGLIYGRAGYASAAVVLQVFAPGLFLMFIDFLLGYTILAVGNAKGFAVVKAVSVGFAALLDVLLVPVFQERLGNGGIALVVAFGASEVVVFGGALLLLPRRTLEPAALADVARAIGAAAVTALAFALLPPLPMVLGIPACVGAFAAASVALGLVGRSDVEVLRSLVRARKAAPVATASESR